MQWKNRVVSRTEAEELDLKARIDLEREITDSFAEGKKLPEIGPDWTFDNYRHAAPWRRHLFEFLGDLDGKVVLDLGCGYHPTSIYFALAGAKEVYACDVSPKAVEFTREAVKKYNLEDRVHVEVCAAETLPYEDDTFDLIHGEAVLHHLDLSLSGPEIRRVLKPGGKAAFKDPLGHNLVLELARDYLPYKWKHSAKGTDSPLKFRKIEEFGEYFHRLEYRGHGLLSLAATWLSSNRKSKLEDFAFGVDAAFLRVLPFMHRYCRFVVTGVEKAPAGPS